MTVINIVLCFSLAFCVVSACMCWYLHLAKLKRKKPDYSFWMYCKKCNVKWRPTAYGPPAPDDYYCPKCASNTHVKWYVGFTLTKVPVYKERSNK